eukprot:TRINITY_DN1334_c1_g1_i1.p1 TRINITY_DN1334_c1_g1~~TRINITY_DN1334_c1_g1_i1.p1  ORF type:complete len:997 (+),score=93.17 TRINITY_DN1334_c1_g1_i1:128-3118(+)
MWGVPHKGLVYPWTMLIVFAAVTILLQAKVPAWYEFVVPALSEEETKLFMSLFDSFIKNAKVFACFWFLYLAFCRNRQGDIFTRNDGGSCQVEAHFETSLLSDKLLNPGSFRQRSVRRVPTFQVHDDLDDAINTAGDYLNFLRFGLCMFFVLSIISIVVVGTSWGTLPLLGIVGIKTTQASSFPNLSVSSTIGNTSRSYFANFGQVDDTQCYTDALVDSMCRLGLNRPKNCRDGLPACSSSLNGTVFHTTNIEECGRAAELRGALLLAFQTSTRTCCIFKTFEGSVGMSRALSQSPQNRSPGFVVCSGIPSHWPTRTILCLSIIYGVVTLFFACMNSKGKRANPTEWELRTVWLTRLPVRDNDDGEFWDIDEDAVEGVSTCIRNAVNDRINRKLLDAYREHASLPDLIAECKVRQVHIARVASTSGKANAQPMFRLSGHAFVVMSHSCYAALLTMNCRPRYVPWFFSWRDHSLLKVGVPPLATSTLRSQRAPPYSDIYWENLHRTQSPIIMPVLMISLAVLMLELVTPTQTMEELEMWNRRVVNSKEQDRHMIELFFYKIAQFLLPYWLTVTNYVVLPWLIYFISVLRKFRLRSEQEALIFVQNYLFLLVFALLVPLLGLESANASILEVVSDGLTNHLSFKAEALGDLARRAFDSSGSTILKYMFSAALATGGTQLVCLSQSFLRWCCCCWCRCPGWRPPDFDWGYWYAWSMSIFTMSLVVSVGMPAMLPLAFLFFCIRYYVDLSNFKRGAVSTTVKMDSTLPLSVSEHMVFAVFLFWLSMSAFFFAQPSRVYCESWWIPKLRFCGATEPCITDTFGGMRVFGTTLNVPAVTVPHRAAVFSRSLFFAISFMKCTQSSMKRGNLHLLFRGLAWTLFPSSRTSRRITTTIPLAVCAPLAVNFFGKSILHLPSMIRIEVCSERVCAWLMLWLSGVCFLAAMAVGFVRRRILRGTAPKDLDENFLDFLLSARSRREEEADTSHTRIDKDVRYQAVFGAD